MREDSRLIRYGSQDFFDQLKDLINSDETFRDLAKGVYDTSELVIIEDLGMGILQRTIKGEISDFKLIPSKELPALEKSSEFVYYVDSYDTMVKMSSGDESFVSMIIEDRLRFKGPLKKAMTFQGANERMEEIIKELVSETIVPTAIQYRKWATEKGYL